MTAMADLLIHQLRLFGLTGAQLRRDGGVALSERVVIRLAHQQLGEAHPKAGGGAAPGHLRALAGQGRAWERLRSFHPFRTLRSEGDAAVVSTLEGDPVWVWRQTPDGGELLIGTDLIADLVLIRQGDPAAALNRPTEAQWGIAGERPTYLFEDQLDAERPQDRMADWWMWTLREALVCLGGVTARDVLPFGAAGAVIVTGDDDQAPLEDYAGQARKLGRLPVTYFLHPLAKHDAGSLASYAMGRAVEWELHPDALETPELYGSCLHDQAVWFTELVGPRPRLVRNHGYLNDGYWGHAQHWLREGIVGSSNLPGVDGRVLNGSLLPARLVLDGVLTPHWSQLTAFGDGVFFVYDWTGDQARDAVVAMAQDIIGSGVPGIIVLNLHPANHERAAGMHEAAHDLVQDLGFAAMTLGDAFAWFSARDEMRDDASTERMIAPGCPTRLTDGGQATGLRQRTRQFLAQFKRSGLAA
jgi:hypothetical protein